MPNITTTLYLNDEDYYKKYLPNKKVAQAKMREELRKFLGVKTPEEREEERDKEKQNSAPKTTKKKTTKKQKE